MIKTIKTKKQIRLDELIKYVIEKGLNSFQFTSDNNVDVYFSSNGYFLIAGDGSGDGGSRSFDLSDTFTVEVEEDITEDTPFEDIVIININGISHLEQGAYHTIRNIRRDYPTVTEIHTLINGKLELIWETK